MTNHEKLVFKKSKGHIRTKSWSNYFSNLNIMMTRLNCNRKLRSCSKSFAVVFFCCCIAWMTVTIILAEEGLHLTVEQLNKQLYDSSDYNENRFKALSKYKFLNSNLTRCLQNFNEIAQPKFQKLHAKVYLLSAYYDNRKKASPFFRILALLRGAAKSTAPPLYCHVVDEDGVTIVRKIDEYVFNENMNSVYGGYILSCPLHDIRLADVCTVKISLTRFIGIIGSWLSSSITLPVLTWNHDHYVDDFAICVPPLFGTLEPSSLIEFVEMHRILGVGHVFFYEYRGADDANFTNSVLRQVVKYYVRQGTVTSYEWVLPLPLKSVRYYGQLLTVHHCMFNNMLRYKYLAFLDLDEFIMPRNDLFTWHDIFKRIDNNQFSGFRFKSVSFPPVANSVNYRNSSYPLITLGQTTRAIGYHTKRTKCVVRPERIFEMGVHHISKWNEEHWPPLDVHMTIGRVHHYRTCFSTFFKGNCNNTETDNTALRYSTALILAYEKTTTELNLTIAR